MKTEMFNVSKNNNAWIHVVGLAATVSFALLNASTRIELTEEALKIHRASLVADGHNDLPWAIRSAGDLPLLKHDLLKNQPGFHTDIPRLREGGMGAQFWSAYVPVSSGPLGTAFKTTIEQIELIGLMVSKYPQDFELALSSHDVERIHQSGKIASLIGVEGGHSIEDSLEKLRTLYAKGTRYMTLTHSKNTAWADSCTDQAKNHGLSAFGEAVVREMNKLGMFVDISHVSADTMRHVMKVTKAPVIASHSSAYKVRPHPRNVPDDVLLLLKANGGVVMVNFYTDFVCMGDPRVVRAEAIRARSIRDCTVKSVVDHIDHITRVAGVDHVGLGSDFDGVPKLPAQLDDVSFFPYITQELLNRGYPIMDIKKILGGNLIRAFKKMESVAESHI